MQPLELSRGARRCLARLDWYRRHYGSVYPRQEKLANGLGVSDRTLRTYLVELRKAGFVVVRQGGDGHPASYHLSQAAISALTSGLLPGCFRAESRMAALEPLQNLSVTGEDFRAEGQQSSSSCSLKSDQSKSTVVEHRDRDIAVIEPTDYEIAQTNAVANAIRSCGFEPTQNLLSTLDRKRRFFGVNGFQIAAAIDRGFKRVKSTSNTPRAQTWFSAVVENEFRSMGRSDDSSKPVAPNSGFGPSVALAMPNATIPDTRSRSGLTRAKDAAPPELWNFVERSA